MRRGCFWNSFIMVGRVGSFLTLVGRAAPSLFRRFQAIAPTFFTKREEAIVFNLYGGIHSSSFSADVLSVCPANLAVLCSKTLGWVDVGDVGRALSLVGCSRTGPQAPGIENSRESEVVRLAGVTA